MVYKYLSVWFAKAEDLFSLGKPIDVFMQFKEALGDTIIGANFNKYSDGNTYFKIDVRFGFDDSNKNTIIEKISQIAEKLEKEENITCDKELKIWIEPDFVVKAHELGSFFAIEFKKWLEQEDNINQKIQDPSKKANLSTQLIYLMLKECDFNIHIIWSILRESPLYEKDKLAHDERIIKFVKNHAVKLKEGLEKFDTNVIPDFLERFLHTFFNCTQTIQDNSEQAFINNVIVSSVYSKLIELKGNRND